MQTSSYISIHFLKYFTFTFASVNWFLDIYFETAELFVRCKGQKHISFWSSGPIFYSFYYSPCWYHRFLSMTVQLKWLKNKSLFITLGNSNVRPDSELGSHPIQLEHINEKCCTNHPESTIDTVLGVLGIIFYHVGWQLWHRAAMTLQQPLQVLLLYFYYNEDGNANWVHKC